MNFVYYFHDECSIDSFESQVLYLKSKYNIISMNTLNDLLINNITFNNTCTITVDDGWISTFNTIFPIIKKHQIPITIFLSPYVIENDFNLWFYLLKYCDENKIRQILLDKGLYRGDISKFKIDLLLKELKINTIYNIINECLSDGVSIKPPRGFINIKELQEMLSSGLVTVGAHTQIHPILKNEENDVSFNEIVLSVRELSRLVGHPVRYFAYPNGVPEVDFSEREKKYVKNVGVDLAFSVEPNFLNKKVDLMSVPRIGSIRRLKFGRLGVYLPSLANQIGIRKKIRTLLNFR